MIKHVVNDNGGNAAPATSRCPSTAISFPGEESPGTTRAIPAGSYDVAEAGPSGYAASYSADCSGTIANGETKTCTVTNDDEPGELVVIKKVVNDDGSAAVAGDFTLNVSGQSFAGVAAPGKTISSTPTATR